MVTARPLPLESAPADGVAPVPESRRADLYDSGSSVGASSLRLVPAWPDLGRGGRCCEVGWGEVRTAREEEGADGAHLEDVVDVHGG